MTTPVLRVSHLRKQFGDFTAVEDVSFSIQPGEILGLLGPNGAGKTTLLQIAAGALAPTEGSVSLPPDEVGWVPQQPAVYAKLTVAENLRFFARLERAKRPGSAGTASASTRC